MGVDFFLFACDNGGAGLSRHHSLSFLFAMKRLAFTLVELLVVIAVIALLVAILIPAVNAARENARRNQCLAHQRSLATAMIDYNKGNDGLPGYLNQFGNTPIHSWAVAIFPMIGEQARYESLMSGSSASEARVSPPALLCPSADKPSEGAWLNYVVNCGPTTSEVANDSDLAGTLTLFKDRRSERTAINRKVKIEEIPDGTSHTILLSENVDAGSWHQDWTGTSLTPDEFTTRSVAALGFIWGDHVDFAPNSSAEGPRPSSRHPGVVIAAFADGSARPINDTISLLDWRKAVCPDDRKLGL